MPNFGLKIFLEPMNQHENQNWLQAWRNSCYKNFSAQSYISQYKINQIT
jgi:hypothetical protein